MKGKKDFFLGIRFSKEEMEQIESIRKGLKLNRSELIRQSVQQAISSENNQFSQLTEEIRELRRKVRTNHQVSLYMAALLTALVRRSSKSSPEEAERMILAARAEAEKRE